MKLVFLKNFFLEFWVTVNRFILFSFIELFITSCKGGNVYTFVDFSVCLSVYNKITQNLQTNCHQS